MMRSRCCKGEVDVYDACEGLSFYSCCICLRACDTVSTWNLDRYCHDDAGREAEIKEFIS